MSLEVALHERSPSRRNSDHISTGKARLPKKLIICCDGTWQSSDNGWVHGTKEHPGHLQIPTNVTRICRAILPEDDEKHPQIVYYQSGLGSSGGLVNRVLGGATGLGLSENIREAYVFLCNNYSAEAVGVEPDSIFLIGFSRGAFTARSLGGFIGAVGVLDRMAMPFFYQCFLDWENAGDPKYKPMFIDAYIRARPDRASFARKGQPPIELAHDGNRIDEYMSMYRKHLCALGLTQEVTINCVGVWDTVGALGIPVNPRLQKAVPFLPGFIREYQWFDTRLSDCINNAFQALALDEARYPFAPSVWENRGDACTTNLKQVWFPGAHSNIGGSYEDSGMANITLAWMMDQLSGNTLDTSKHVFRAREWIQFDEHFIDHWNFETSEFYAKQPTQGKTYHGWAMGKVYQSNTFPLSMLGRMTRSPGRYRRTNYITGRPTKDLLQNTNEHVHSSVRARIDLAGRSLEAQTAFQAFLIWLWRLLTFQKLVRFYKPQHKAGWVYTHGPLFNWRLQDGHHTHREPNLNIDTTVDGLSRVEWEFVGPGTPSTRIMPEDRMAPGGYEEKLMIKHGEAVARKISYSNQGWHPVESTLENLQNASNF